MFLTINRFTFIIICSIIYVSVIKSTIADEDKKSEGHEVTTENPAQNDSKNLTEHESDKKKELLPKISFNEPNHNFGKVFRGSKVEHVFRFKNEGKGTLKIEKTRSSCGCTAAIISEKTIVPNEFGEVKVTFSTQSSSGKVTKRVTIYSNDPDNPKYKLSVTGTVVEEVVVKPKRLDFSRTPHGKGSSKKISVKSVTDLKLEIKKIESTNPNVSTTLIESSKKDGYVINAVLKNDADFGRINGNIYIFTNSKKQEKITIPFFGEVIGDLSVYPPRISLGVISQKREMVFPAFAIVYNKDVKVERVEVTPDFIDTAITETKSSRKTYKIETIIKKDSPAGKVNGNLKIFTNSKKQPVIDIPVIGKIKEVITNAADKE